MFGHVWPCLAYAWPCLAHVWLMLGSCLAYAWLMLGYTWLYLAMVGYTWLWLVDSGRSSCGREGPAVLAYLPAYLLTCLLAYFVTYLLASVLTYLQAKTAFDGEGSAVHAAHPGPAADGGHLSPMFGYVWTRVTCTRCARRWPTELRC